MLLASPIVTPKAFMLPVLGGGCDDFNELLTTTRSFARRLEGPLGPQVINADESLWRTCAREGTGTLEGDTAILDRYVEIVLAYDPLERQAAVTCWRPSVSSVLREDHPELNRILSFISLGLKSAELSACMFTGIEPALFDEDRTNLVMNDLCSLGGGVQLDLCQLKMEMAFQEIDWDDAEGDGLIDLAEPAEHSFLADWLELIAPDCDGTIHLCEEVIHERLDALYRRVFRLPGGLSERRFRMAAEALLRRVAMRTREMRALYPGLSSEWPDIEPFRTGCPDHTITICLTTRELATHYGTMVQEYQDSLASRNAVSHPARAEDRTTPKAELPLAWD